MTNNWRQINPEYAAPEWAADIDGAHCRIWQEGRDYLATRDGKPCGSFNTLEGAKARFLPVGRA